MSYYIEGTTLSNLTEARQLAVRIIRHNEEQTSVIIYQSKFQKRVIGTVVKKNGNHYSFVWQPDRGRMRPLQYNGKIYKN